MKIIHLQILILFSLLSLKCQAQRHYFKAYTTEEGLVQSQVRAIHQDTKGYLWIGTANGLSVFNGKKFKNYSSNQYLVDPQINFISKRKSGGIWVVTSKGVSIFNGNKIETIDLSSKIDNGNIYDAVEDLEGNLWCLIYKKGLLFLPNSKSKEVLFFENESPHVDIELNNKELYLINQKGIDVFSIKTNTFSKLPSDDLKPRSISKYSTDTLVLACEMGLYFINNKKIFKTQISETANINAPRSIYVDSKKNIWTASKIGVHSFSVEKLTTFNSSNGLEFEDSRVVFEDSDENIWIGTEGGGLFKYYTNQEFVTYTTEDGLPSEQIMSIIEKENEFWFSTYSDGIFSKKDTLITQFNKENGLANSTVWSSCIGENEDLWFGTSSGLSKYSNGKFTNYTTKEGLPSNRVTALLLDKNNTLWVGCSSGLALISEDTIISNSSIEHFSGHRIRGIKEGNNQKIWIGAKNALYSYFNNTINLEFNIDSISRNAQIYTIEILNENIIIGTSSGLLIYNIKTKTINNLFWLGDALSFSTHFLKKIDNQTFWAGSADGVYLVKLNPNLTKILELTRYAKKNGIYNLETNQNAAFIDKNNKLWFGTSQGLVHQNQEILTSKSLKTPLSVSINDVLLFLEPIDTTKHEVDDKTSLPINLRLKHNENHITFNYESVSLAYPNEIKYRFMLEGFDEKWLPFSYDNSFSYTNLPFGNYTFFVSSSFDGIKWNESTQFHFEILPPFWLTKWFLLLASILFLGLVALIFMWRKNVNFRKLETERLHYKNKLLHLEQQSLSSSMNRHFIFNALNSIQYYINTQDRLSANKYLSSFAKLIRKNLESSGSKNNLITLKEELERVELYLELENMRFQNKIIYSIETEHRINLDEILLPPMFFQPFIENSIWHGILPNGGGKVEVKIFYRDEKDVVISIVDDGVGIDVSQKNKNTTSHNSKGVSITKRRIELLEKTINKKIAVIGPEEIIDINNLTIGTKVEIVIAAF